MSILIILLSLSLAASIILLLVKRSPRSTDEELQAYYKKLDRTRQEAFAENQKKIEEQMKCYEDQLQKLKNEYETNAAELQTKYNAKTKNIVEGYNNMLTVYDAKFKEASAQYENKLRANYESQAKEYQSNYVKNIKTLTDNYETKVQTYNAQLAEYEKKVKDLTDGYEKKVKEYQVKERQLEAERSKVQNSYDKVRQRYEVWKGKSVEEGRRILGIRTAERETKLKELESKYNVREEEVLNSLIEIEERLEEAKHIEQSMLKERLERANVEREGKLILSDRAVKELKELWELCETINLPNKRPLYKAIYECYIQGPLRILCSYGDKKCGIYRVWDIESGMGYVGQARDIGERWREHIKCGVRMDTKGVKYGSFYDALWDRGIWNFRWEVVEECGVEKLNEREKWWIDYFDTFNNGFNGTRGNGV